MAAGIGRNSSKLIQFADRLYIVDVQEHAIRTCRERFANQSKVTVVNNGYDISGVADSAVTLVYCFDAMVHFDSDVVRSYLRDCHRILKAGGRGFFHHSNYVGGHDWRTNPGSRRFMSAELFGHYAWKEGLSIIRQKPINWGNRINGDCLSLVEKPVG